MPRTLTNSTPTTVATLRKIIRENPGTKAAKDAQNALDKLHITDRPTLDSDGVLWLTGGVFEANGDRVDSATTPRRKPKKQYKSVDRVVVDCMEKRQKPQHKGDWIMDSLRVPNRVR